MQAINEIFGFIGIIISIILILVFFVMSSNLSKIKNELRTISRLLIQMGEKTDSFNKYTCNNCGKEFYRKRRVCPYCKKPVKY